MIILGLNLFHADASAAILIDGDLIFAVAEERLNRKKHYAGFPALSIQACLDAAGAKLEDLDHLAIGRRPGSNCWPKVRHALRNPALFTRLARMRSRANTFNDMKELIAKEMGVDCGLLRFTEHRVEHHIAHAASAFFPSDMDEAACFSCDGSGDFVSTMFSHGRGNRLEPVHRIYSQNSLGIFYTAGCQFIGYQKYGDEGKVMGLAPYGKDSFRSEFQEMVSLQGDGVQLSPAYFKPFGTNDGFRILDDGSVVNEQMTTGLWSEKFGDPREPLAEYTDRDKDLVHGMQRRFEDAILHLLQQLHQRVPVNEVAIAGGCALNSSANGKIFDNTPFKRTWIQPAAGDEGLSVGSALYVYHHVLGNQRKFVMKHAYWGPEFNDNECKAALDAEGLSYKRLDRPELVDFASSKLADKAIVGWFQGRMEWGPRALGNRSILAHPGPPEMKDVLNARIKHREWFRPFAPSVLAEHQSDYFEHAQPSPFMLHVFKVRPERREEIAAVTHVDGTGRFQSVTRKENELYYDLISAFHKKTGTPVLLNTSFNDNEPIVCSPKDAVDCYVRTGMDILCLGNFVVEAAEQDSKLPNQ